MIPRTITREHILQALRNIDEHGVPPGRSTRKYALSTRDVSTPRS